MQQTIPGTVSWPGKGQDALAGRIAMVTKLIMDRTGIDAVAVFHELVGPVHYLTTVGVKQQVAFGIANYSIGLEIKLDIKPAYLWNTVRKVNKGTTVSREGRVIAVWIPKHPVVVVFELPCKGEGEKGKTEKE